MSNGQYERELVRSLHACGFGVMRCPSSGSATDRPLPDVIAGQKSFGRYGHPEHDKSDAWAIELKTTSKTTAYVKKTEAEGLWTFADRFGATPYMAARFKGGKRTPYYLVPLDDCRMTDSGNYGVPQSDAEERADVLIWPETDARDAEVEYVG